MEIIDKKFRNWALIAMFILGAILAIVLSGLLKLTYEQKLNTSSVLFVFLILVGIIFYITRSIDPKVIEEEECQRRAKFISSGKMTWFAVPNSSGKFLTGIVLKKELRKDQFGYAKTTEEIGKLLAEDKVMGPGSLVRVYEILTKK